MKAEIISIGDEVLIGQIINTNAAYLGEQFMLAGIPPQSASVVGDDLRVISHALGSAWENHDIIVTTGGLGPTHDDVTRDAVVDFFRTELVFSEYVFEDITRFFSRRGRTMLPVHRDQAQVPACASVIRNAIGTAPGFHIERDGKHLFVLPGIPDEMKAMTEHYVLPRIRPLVSDAFVARTLQSTGIPESNLAALLDAPNTLPDGLSLAFLPSPFGIRLRISTRDSSRDDAVHRCGEAVSMIMSKAGEFIFDEGKTSLSECLGRLLTDRGLRIAVAESCTGGMLANIITDTPGSSAYFDSGMLTYSDASKVEMLGIDPLMLRDHGAVSSSTAMAMAAGIRKRTGADIGLSTTGIAGPGGATPIKPVGLVWIGLSVGETLLACKYLFGEDRLRTKQRASQAALDLVRRHLLGLPHASPIVLETALNV